MKNKKIFTITALVLAVTAALGITAAAAYDSSEDPLITWSYLRDIFKPEILDIIDERFAEYEVLLENLEKAEETEAPEEPIETEAPDETEAPEESEEPAETEPEKIPAETVPEYNEPAPTISMTYEVIELKDGDAIYAISACDIMLRAGSAFCIAPDERQGIADYTSGEEIYNGMPLTKNHMCLIPRGDGRGVLAASESVFIMVRGDYTIVRK